MFEVRCGAGGWEVSDRDMLLQENFVRVASAGDGDGFDRTKGWKRVQFSER